MPNNNKSNNIPNLNDIMRGDVISSTLEKIKSLKKNKKPNYRIRTKPRLTNIMRGKAMSFFLERINPNAPAVENITAIWLRFYNFDKLYKRLTQPWDVITLFGPVDSPAWIDCKFDREGVHKIVCTVIYNNCIQEEIECFQHVINEKQTESYSSLTIEESMNPFIVYKQSVDMIAQIRELEKEQQLTDEEEKAYQERMNTMEQSKKRLNFLLEKIPTDCRENFGQMHVKHIANIYGDLDDKTLNVGYFYNGQQVYIVDWTNYLDRTQCGVYEGTGKNKRQALQQAIACWDRKNRYSTGVIRGYAEVAKSSGVIKNASGNDIVFGAIEINFDTDGKSDVDTLSNALATAGLVLSIIAAVATLFIPVPGSQVVSAILWASIAASTTSAVINIADRHLDGFSDWKADTLDILTIVGNIFSAGSASVGTKWACKTIALANITQKQATKIILIGQITTDSMQGILVTEELADAIYSVMNDKALPADIKLSQLSQLLTRGLIDGVLISVGVSGSAKNLKAVKNVTTPHNKISQEDIYKYISGEKKFSKVDFEDTLSKQQNKTASSKKEPSKIPSKDKVSPNNLPSPSDRISDIAEELKSITPYTKEMYNTKIIETKIPDDKGIKKSFSGVLRPEWQLAYVGNGTKAVSGDYFEKMLYRNLEIGKKRTSLKAKKGEISDATVLDSGTRKDNTRNSESKTTCSTNYATKTRENGRKELERELDALKKSGLSPKQISKRVALAQTRCEVEGIVSEANFYNLDTPKYVSLKRENIVRAIDEKYFEITDVKKYMDILKDSYKSSSSLYPSVTPAYTTMHPLTEKSIADFIANKKKFRIQDGLPGLHAEVLSTNNVYHQLTAEGKNPALYMDKIEVNTIRLTQHEQGNAFPACRHCSGILSKSKGISIPTGRVDD